MSPANTQAVLARWNGATWARVSLPIPRGARSAGLFSVSCVSTTFCWAVGDYDTSSKTLPYVLKWNGAAWSLSALPRPANTIHLAPFSVSCSSTADCWTAQVFGSPLLEHWNGAAWRMAPAAALGQPFNPQLSCVKVNDCWMVGAHADGSGTFTAHWDGSTWSVLQTPTSNLASHVLSGLSCLKAACMAVGGNGARAENHPLAQRWNGSAWKITSTGTVGTHHAALNAVSCITGVKCLAVGGRSGRQSPGAFSELWDGAHWHTLTTPTPSTGLNQLRGVSCVTALDCWAVGGIPGVNSGSLIEHWNGSAWSIVS